MLGQYYDDMNYSKSQEWFEYTKISNNKFLIILLNWIYTKKLKQMISGTDWVEIIFKNLLVSDLGKNQAFRQFEESLIAFMSVQLTVWNYQNNIMLLFSIHWICGYHLSPGFSRMQTQSTVILNCNAGVQ